MEIEDIRWEQRFSNYRKALGQLEKAVVLAQTRQLSELEQQGLIQAFEFTHELAWNVMKDYAHYQGNANIKGSRDATREAFGMALIANGEDWMGMIKARNSSSHTYNQETADEMAANILHSYFPLFKEFLKKMEEIRTGEQGKIR